MTGPRYSQAGVQALKHGQQVTLTPTNVRGMVPADGEAAFRVGDRIVPARQARNLLAAVEGLPPAHDCPSLGECRDHPRWSVSCVPIEERYDDEPWGAYPPLRFYTHHWFRTQAEAFAYATVRARADQLGAIESSEGAGR